MNAKQKARYIMHRNPELIIIDKECPHEGVTKEHHHPDYSKPYHIELLCVSCHRKIGAGQRKCTPRNKKSLAILSVNIRKARREMDITQTELGMRMGITKQRIGELENLSEDTGTNTRTLAMFMNVFNKTADDLLGRAKIAEALDKKTDDFFIEART